jgi:molecular chaperone Hsp33
VSMNGATVGLAAAQDDIVLPFAVEELDVRGRVVRLSGALDTILERHAYPPAVARVVGEAAALTVLLGSSLKFDGRFQFQTKSDGVIDMIVIDFEAPDRLRGYARFDPAKLEAAITGSSETAEALSARLLGTGYLGLTIDQGPDMQRYQGLVALEGQGLEAAAHQYFKNSEQIPTVVRLAVGEMLVQGENGPKHAWRAGGLLAQFLPEAPERLRQPDLSPGDAPEGTVLDETSEDDAWLEAKALASTVEDLELVDPQLSSERLLYRLFNERGVRVFDAQPVHEACRCSEERIVAMLRNFSPDERRDMIADDGMIKVTCEFCSRHYVIAPADAV